MTSYETYKKPIVQPITYRNNMYRANKWIKPFLEGRDIREFRAIDCQEVMNNMAKSPYVNSKDMYRKVMQMLKFAFSMAVENELIEKSPAESIVVPKGTKMTKRSITEEERKAVYIAAGKRQEFLYFLFMLECGLRPSEAAGIKGGDINRKTRMLHVRGTKTENALRYVPIPGTLLEKVPDVPDEDYLFTNHAGNYLDENGRNNLWKRFWKQLNIVMGCKMDGRQLMPPYPLASDFTPYCLRHTFATDCAKKGIDVRVVQRLMGHSSITITSNIYTHVDDEMLEEAAELMEKPVPQKKKNGEMTSEERMGANA
ncbi:MAG: tyrosine-type recombinase/integrase [Anaerovoracaceae bacterium]